ncbi:hypothetical protein Aph01nite_08110 [Acrocarpospora phusangensis]|uniref:Uncharacterized protein n=1 Tax=Acrocarpospora phusangensis TaxID=1070424 RepID=A0A919UIB5_9ACTN|nr:hypothetical protein Aph01nite_08110 [Acrocarpospora phusangensis]
MATVRVLRGGQLVRPETGHALPLQSLAQLRGDPIRPLGLTSLTCWNMLHVSDSPVPCRGRQQALKEWSAPA